MFLRTLGRHRGTPMYTDAEGSHGYAVLGFDVDADRVVVPADAQGRPTEARAPSGEL